MEKFFMNRLMYSFLKVTFSQYFSSMIQLLSEFSISSEQILYRAKIFSSVLFVIEESLSEIFKVGNILKKDFRTSFSISMPFRSRIGFLMLKNSDKLFSGER